jgi:hypothetical protein
MAENIPNQIPAATLRRWVLLALITGLGLGIIAGTVALLN